MTSRPATFCPDSGLFAVAYHYSRPILYTWIGYWSLTSGRLDHSRVVDNKGLF